MLDSCLNSSLKLPNATLLGVFGIGTTGGGAELTPIGHRLIQIYRAMEDKALAAVNADFRTRRKPYSTAVEKPCFSKIGFAAADVRKSSNRFAAGSWFSAVRQSGDDRRMRIGRNIPTILTLIGRHIGLDDAERRFVSGNQQ
jgi:hypothetical protein